MQNLKDALKKNIIDKEKIRENVILKYKKENTSKTLKYIKTYNKVACVFIFCILISIPLVLREKNKNENNQLEFKNNSQVSVKDNYYKATIDDSNSYITQEYLDNALSSSITSKSIMDTDTLETKKPFVIYKSRKYEYNQDLNYYSSSNLKYELIGSVDKDIKEFYNDKTKENNIYANVDIGTKLYSIKGYDPNVIVIADVSGKESIIESTDKLKVDTFLEINKIFDLKNNIESVQAIDDEKNITNNIKLELFNSVLTCIENSSIINSYSVLDPIYTRYKIVKINLKYGILVEFKLYYDGYIKYKNLVFKIENSDYKTIYNSI